MEETLSALSSPLVSEVCASWVCATVHESLLQGLGGGDSFASWLSVWKCNLSSDENSSGPEDPLSDSSSRKLLSGVASRVPVPLGVSLPVSVDVVENPDPSGLGRNGLLL